MRTVPESSKKLKRLPLETSLLRPEMGPLPAGKTKSEEVAEGREGETTSR
jgi:hypothetical protein